MIVQPPDHEADMLTTCLKVWTARQVASSLPMHEYHTYSHVE